MNNLISNAKQRKICNSGLVKFANNDLKASKIIISNTNISKVQDKSKNEDYMELNDKNENIEKGTFKIFFHKLSLAWKKVMADSYLEFKIYFSIVTATPSSVTEGAT